MAKVSAKWYHFALFNFEDRNNAEEIRETEQTHNIPTECTPAAIIAEAALTEHLSKTTHIMVSSIENEFENLQ